MMVLSYYRSCQTRSCIVKHYIFKKLYFFNIKIKHNLIDTFVFKLFVEYYLSSFSTNLKKKYKYNINLKKVKKKRFV